LAAQKSTALTTPIIGTTIQTVVFGTESIDINNAHVNTTGIYTVPVSDTYEINSSMEFLIQGQNFTGDSSVCVVIQRATTTLSQSCLGDSDDTPRGPNSSNVNVSATLALTTGQQINIGVYRKGLTGTLTFVATANTNFLTIKRVGNATVVSDIRLKKDINDYTLGLKDILALNIKSYLYNGLSKNAINDGVTHVGILAQDLQNTAIGNYAIATNTDGFLKFDKDPLIFAAINAIKEQNKLLMGKDEMIKSLMNASNSIEILNNIRTETPISAYEYITNRLASSTGMISDFVSARVTAVRGYFDEIFAKKIYTEQICVKKSDGTNFCANGDQLQNAVNNIPSNNPNPNTNNSSGNIDNNSSTSTDSGAGGVDINSSSTSIVTDNNTDPSPNPDPNLNTENTNPESNPESAPETIITETN
jgi:hypothetical protein